MNHIFILTAIFFAVTMLIIRGTPLRTALIRSAVFFTMVFFYMAPKEKETTTIPEGFPTF